MKVVKEERLAIILTLTRERGTSPVEVSCRADYEVASDDLVVTRSHVPKLTVAQEDALKKFAAGILTEIKALEA
ncbi:hypothetical protein LCGC14_1855450 [marine sediment metagenome]|uniref:Uncharacterized protein n=1 Tax=marine sediment metagenome TaxID=412755 RepID=A0A0F9G921_9ZZZZ